MTATAKISINMCEYGKHGWQFTIRDESGNRTFRTNGDGDGLWVWCKSTTCWHGDGSPHYEFQQSMGTCQFCLPRQRERAYRRIRYLIETNQI